MSVEVNKMLAYSSER